MVENSENIDTTKKKEKEDDILVKLKDTLISKGVVILKEDEVIKERPHIGQGGFGKVYKGMYGEQKVAIKKILLATNDEAAAKDIINEIAVVMLVNHEKIPKFYGLWEKKKRFHLIFEFINGPTLKDVYKKYSDKQKLDFMVQVMDVLSVMHSKKLIHRDIKPSNVMIENEKTVRLIDFGVSKIAQKTETFTKNPSGTVFYMPPDNFQVDEDTEKDAPIAITPKVDIWALGCMISEIFSDVLPWTNKVNSEMGIRKKLILKHPFPIPVNVPKNIVPIIEMCTKVEVSERCNLEELRAFVVKTMEEIID